MALGNVSASTGRNEPSPRIKSGARALFLGTSDCVRWRTEQSIVIVVIAVTTITVAVQ